MVPCAGGTVQCPVYCSAARFTAMTGQHSALQAGTSGWCGGGSRQLNCEILTSSKSLHQPQHALRQHLTCPAPTCALVCVRYDVLCHVTFCLILLCPALQLSISTMRCLHPPGPHPAATTATACCHLWLLPPGTLCHCSTLPLLAAPCAHHGGLQLQQQG
jgi:hypothetical protein